MFGILELRLLFQETLLLQEMELSHGQQQEQHRGLLQEHLEMDALGQTL